MSFWWLIQKDLVCEYRAKQAWPTMILSGIVVAFIFGLHLEHLPQQQRQATSGLLWLAVFFAGMTAIDRSFASDRADGGWSGMKLLPVSPTLVYLAKLTVNAMAMTVLECLMIPLFFILSNVPLGPHLGEMALIGLLVAMALAAVGTLVSALTAGSGKTGSLLVLVLLPMAIPVVLGAAECTRMTFQNQVGQAWWGWIQLLGAFNVIFITAGTVLFEFAMED